MMTDDRKEGSGAGVETLRVPVYGLFILGILYTLYLAHEVILPITLATLTSLLLSPLVRRFSRKRIPRAVTALVLLTLLVIAIGGIGAVVAKPVMQWVDRIPEGISKLMDNGTNMAGTIENLMHAAERVESALEGLSEERPPVTVVLQSESWLGQFLVRMQATLVGLALALTLTFFLLVNGDRLIHNFVRQFPRNHRRRMILRLIRDSQREIARYLSVITLSNVLVGLVTLVMAWLLDLPNPMVWGVLAALLRFIPYLGVLVTVILLGVVSAVSQDELWLMLAAPVGYILLTAIVGVFIEPFVHGYRMSINPILIFLAIFFWGWLWGAIGVLLAVPLMTVIQVILKQIGPLKPLYRVIAR